VPANRLTEILRGQRAISAETALSLGRYFGTGAVFWMTLQGNYDLALAEQELGDRIDQEVDAASPSCRLRKQKYSDARPLPQFLPSG
jgi:antitoxin HigA-1